MVIDYRISDIVPYINWIYFFHAWGLSGKPESEQEKQKHEALRMLEEWEDRYQTHAVVEIVDANSDGDDIIAAGTRIPFLLFLPPYYRKQKSAALLRHSLFIPNVYSSYFIINPIKPPHFIHKVTDKERSEQHYY